MKAWNHAAILMAGVSSVSVALAQAQTESGQERTEAGPAPSASLDELVEIVVTGSRIVRDGSSAPTPVTLVTTDALQQAAPSNLPDALNKLPQFNNSTNQTVGATFQAGRYPTGNLLNLRSLGTERVLVLFNGQRVTPTSQSNAVDTNMLPQLLIDRVETTTGGVSAVYGSDAVSGAVNFILDETYTGIKGVAQTGLSDSSDNFSYRLGLAGGFDLGENIHVLTSYDHYDSNGISSVYDRGWAHDAPVRVGAGTAAQPHQVVNNGLFTAIAYGGLITSGPLADQMFLPSGELVPFDPGVSTISSQTQIGGDGIKFGTEDTGAVPLSTPLQTDQAFGRIAFRASDSLEVFAQGIYAQSQTDAPLAPFNARSSTSTRRITIFSDNPYLRPVYAAQIPNGAGGTPGSFILSRMGLDFPLMSVDINTEYWSGQLGLRGEIFDGWTWDANYVHGRAEFNIAANEPMSRNYYAALDAVRDPTTGNIVCGVTLRNPGFLDNCFPINVLGEGNPSQAALDFIFQDSKGRTINEMDYVNFNLQGHLFDLPAGAVKLAFGAEYREQTLDQTSNADPTFFQRNSRADYFAGIRGVPGNANIFGVTNIGTAEGKQTVKEAYAETVIPILRDVPLAKTLELNLAGRITDYKTSGQVETDKIGLSWEIFDGLRFRGNYSRDIRAPSLFELFAGSSVRTAGATDPLTRTDSTLQVISGGNENLDPEIAKTTTLGIVVQPYALPGLTFATDFYDIKISGALQAVGFEDVLRTCFASGGTDQTCALITRPGPLTDTSPANYPLSVREVQLNLAQLEARGIDFELGYRTNLDGWFPDLGAALDLRAFVTYLDKFETDIEDLAGKDYPGGGADINGLPKWKGLLRQTFATESFSLSLSERFTGSYQISANNRVYANPKDGHMPNRTYVDANFTYNLTDQGTQVFLNIQNLFDVDPPVRTTSVVTNLNAPTDKTAYDIIGRYLTAGVRFKF